MKVEKATLTSLVFWAALLGASFAFIVPAFAQTNPPESAAPAVKPAAKPIKKKAVAPKAAEAKASAETKASEEKPAARSGKIEKIIIKGNKKIETDAVLAKLVSKEGEDYSLLNIRKDVEELFRSGFFYDVIVDQEGSGDHIVLTYTVLEKPAVVEIVYDGNEEIDDEELQSTGGLKAYEILDVARIREAIEKIEKLYEDKGYFLARVDYKLQEVKDPADGVKLTINVRENDKVQVKKITFLGNQNLVSGKLKNAMMTKEGGFFSFLSGAGSYKQEAFDRDVQIINFLYFNEGYVQVKVDRPQVYVTPDKKGIYITIRVEEGEQFHVGTVDFAGDLLFPKEELFESIETKEGKLFVYETLQKDLETLRAKYGDLGYAFANVIPRTRIREKDKLVDITFEIDKGNKVYIGKINVLGNSKTRDKVLRRELKIREGELYNETRKRESISNIKRLGYFEEVNFNQKTHPNDPTKVDIDIVVKERNTGTVQVGAGYSSFYGFVFNGQVSQINFLGKGQSLSAALDYSKKQQMFKLSFTEPFFADTEWSLGFDAYKSRRELTEYIETKTGGAIRVGHPLAPYLDGIIRYKLDDTNLDLTPDGDPDLFPVKTADGVTSSLTFTLEYDRRNDRFLPTKGVFASASLEYAGLGGDKKYTKGFGAFRYYKELFWDIVWRNNISYGFIRSNDPNEQPPFNELFLLGGANTLRGYDWFTVGRRKYSNKAFQELQSAGVADAYAKSFRPFGGTQQLFYNLEFQFPLIDEAGIKGVVFYDIGTAEDTIVLSQLRSDVGFGFRWYSPIGPLRFEWGFPFNKRDEYGENGVNFQFAIGSPF